MALMVEEDKLKALLFAYMRRPFQSREEFNAAVQEIIEECKKGLDKDPVL